MRHIIKKILKEEINSKVINLVIDNLNSGRIKPPYFYNLKELGLNEDEIELILTNHFNGNVDMKNTMILDKKDNPLYAEDYYYGDWWVIYEYDDKNRLIYHETSNKGVILDKRK